MTLAFYCRPTFHLHRCQRKELSLELWLRRPILRLLVMQQVASGMDEVTHWYKLGTKFSIHDHHSVVVVCRVRSRILC